MGTRRIIEIAGDVTIDWNLARTKRAESGGWVWHAGDRSCASSQAGGAAMLAEVVGAVAKGVEGWAAVGVRAGGRTLRPGDPRYHHSFALWSLHERDRDKPGAAAKVWRVETFLGLDRARGAPAEPPDGDPNEASILVLDDADLGFRDRPRSWPNVLQGRPKRGSPRWIVLKMARPVAAGPLWSHLVDHYADRLIVVMTVNDLRLTEVQVSRELSWERTAQDLAWELVHNPNVNALAHCKHVLVSFDGAGAFLMSARTAAEQRQVKETTDPAERQDPGTHRFRLFFDPEHIEATWKAAYPGGVVGYTTCLTAAVCAELMRDPETPRLERGIQSGLHALRSLHQLGYAQRGTGRGATLSFPDFVDGETVVPEHLELAFPTTRIAAEIAAAKPGFSAAEVRDPACVEPGSGIVRRDRGKEYWTLLGRTYAWQLYPVARDIVRWGPAATLHDTPLGQMGRLLTVDRREIESFRSIRALIAEYLRQSPSKRPLSIAVFGAPGAGKSFAVHESAKALLGRTVKKLDFNLSQFKEPRELQGAFHRVRDTVLQGSIPLVFWDEFDTSLGGQQLGWLRHFLAPMQDGHFLEGETLHPIGRAIFVFAGGTAFSMAEFTSQRASMFKAAKGPDFASRLKGHIDIAGPNPNPDPESDPHYILRRAILLRHMLEDAAPQLFADGRGGGELNIDVGVLRAFLEAECYRHGARSMESLLGMSLLAGRTRFERSSLPTTAQLNLHVDSANFLERLGYDVFDDDTLERMARRHHAFYCAEATPAAIAARPYLGMAYDDLPEDIKESNREAVRDIPRKLAAAGYIAIRAQAGASAKDFPGPEIERQAEMEHDRWMRSKIAAGWQFGVPRDNQAKRHNWLLPWDAASEEELLTRFTEKEVKAMGHTALPDEAKAIDRLLIRAIPGILWEAGLTVELRG